MRAYKLTYDGGAVEYYPIEEGNSGTCLDSSWNKTILPTQIEEIEVKHLWFVKMQKMVWDESESVWTTKKNIRVSPYRLTQQEADDDFHKLGCIDLRQHQVVKAQSIKVPNCLLLQFIVQCKSFNHCDAAINNNNQNDKEYENQEYI